MALKTLQKKYDELLKVFEEVGVTLTESQKESLDTFMLDFQNKLNETRDNAIKATKKLVEEKMEREFKEVFESITAHQKEVFEKSQKIDLIKSHKLLSEAVDQYLNDYVKEVLPKKSIVDYSRMQKLEQIHESLKGMLLVNEDSVEKKVEEVKKNLEAKMMSESEELKKELEKCKQLVEESRKSRDSIKKEYDALAKKSLISEKIKNLPIVESKRVQEKLSKMTVEEIKRNFKTVLESVQAEMTDEQDKIQEEKNLEEAITELLEGDDSEKTGKDDDKRTETNTDATQDSTSDETQVSDEEDEGGVQVTESMMQNWIETLARITPKH